MFRRRYASRHLSRRALVSMQVRQAHPYKADDHGADNRGSTFAPPGAAVLQLHHQTKETLPVVSVHR